MLPMLGRRAHCRHQLVAAERLAEVGAGARVLSAPAQLWSVLHGDQHDRDLGQLGLEVVRQPDAVLVGQVDVDHHHVRAQAARFVLRQQGGVRRAENLDP